MDETWGYIHTSQRKWRWSNSKQPRWNAETGVLEPLMAFIHLAFWNWMIFSPSTFWYVNWLIKNWWIKMHFVQQKHISETCNSSSILKVGSVNNWFHNWFYCSLLVPSLYSLASEHQGAGFRLVTYIVSHDMAPKKNIFVSNLGSLQNLGAISVPDVPIFPKTWFLVNCFGFPKLANFFNVEWKISGPAIKSGWWFQTFLYIGIIFYFIKRDVIPILLTFTPSFFKMVKLHHQADFQ